MLSNYLKTAFRSLAKQKVFTAINVFGLTVGLVSFLLIALYVFDELTYDGFHENADDIYRIVETRTSAGGKESKVVSVAANIATHLRRDFPEVTAATRFSMLGRVNVTNEENTNVFYESYFMADSSFFSIFDFPSIAGQLTTALNQPHTVVLTEQTAQKMFGYTDIVGKTIQTEGDSIPYKITAVISIPGNSHLQFNLLFSEASLYRLPQFAQNMQTDWSSNNYVTYLRSGIARTEEQMARMEAGITRMVSNNRKGDGTVKSSFALQPLRDIHFYSAGLEGAMDTGNINHIYILSIVALFVLLIACINYINLTTARFAGRSKEVAVRKVTGAARHHLVKQFMTEALIVTLGAVLLALGIVKLVLPRFNAFTEKELRLGFNADYRIWVIVVGTAILVGLLSGLYPALFQSGMKPFLLLKQKAMAGKGNLSVRRMLVVFQFSLSIIMLIATIVVYQQMKYVNTADMGFNKEQLVVVDINSGLVRRGAETIKTEFKKIPGVSSVSVSSRVPGEWKVIPKVKVQVPGRYSTQAEDVYYMAADEEFLKTFQVRLEQGRNFTAAADSSAVLLNETAAKMLGVSQPSEQLIEIPSIAFSGNPSQFPAPFRARVVGIVKDFNFQSFREKVGPMIIGYQRNPVHNIDYFTTRVSTANTTELLEAMEAVLQRIDASHLFEYNFLDRKWDQFYREDQKRQSIFLGIAVLTILIACLGLFGLATYAAEQRIKEIGIRKVLGASVASIVALLTKEFARPVLLASLIALPTAWWAMNNWLQEFAYRISIAWWVFVVASVAALAIALGTVSFQAIKAAVSNPVKSLRTE